MIKPSIAELTKENSINRYTLVIAAAKSARIITDEYVRQKDYAEKLAMSKEADKNKNIATLIKREYRDDKAVQLAVNGLAKGEFRILSPEEAEELHRQEEERRAEEAEQRRAEEMAKAESARAELAAAGMGLLDDDEEEEFLEGEELLENELLENEAFDDEILDAEGTEEESEVSSDEAWDEGETSDGDDE